MFQFAEMFIWNLLPMFCKMISFASLHRKNEDLLLLYKFIVPHRQKQVTFGGEFRHAKLSKKCRSFLNRTNRKLLLFIIPRHWFQPLYCKNKKCWIILINRLCEWRKYCRGRCFFVVIRITVWCKNRGNTEQLFFSFDSIKNPKRTTSENGAHWLVKQHNCQILTS